MNPILVVYTTREGQTRRIAEHVAANLKRQGLSLNLLEGRYVPAGLSLGGYSAVILAASVHRGKHESEMVRFVRDRRTELQQLPTALLSASLSQAALRIPAHHQIDAVKRQLMSKACLLLFSRRHAGIRLSPYQLLGHSCIRNNRTCDAQRWRPLARACKARRQGRASLTRPDNAGVEVLHAASAPSIWSLPSLAASSGVLPF